MNTIKEEVVEDCFDLASQALPSLRKLFLLLGFGLQELEVDAEEIMDHMALREVIFMSSFHFLRCALMPLGLRARALRLWQLIVL